jgi:hypothetical protein
MGIQWFYAKNGQQFGPLNAQALKQLADKGELSPSDLVWKEGMTKGKVASKIVGLFTDTSQGQSTATVSQPPSPPTTTASAYSSAPPPPPIPPVWHVRTPDGKQYGPLTGSELKDYLKRGTITADSFVWQTGWPQWRPASEMWPAMSQPLRPPVLETQSDETTRTHNTVRAATQERFAASRTKRTSGIPKWLWWCGGIFATGLLLFVLSESRGRSSRLQPKQGNDSRMESVVTPAKKENDPKMESVIAAAKKEREDRIQYLIKAIASSKTADSRDSFTLPEIESLQMELGNLRKQDYIIPTLESGDLKVGSIGRLTVIEGWRVNTFKYWPLYEPLEVKVLQVVDKENMLVQLVNYMIDKGKEVYWVQRDTNGIVDDQKITLDQVYEVTGTTTYQTAFGGSKTVFQLAPYQLPADFEKQVAR